MNRFVTLSAAVFLIAVCSSGTPGMAQDPAEAEPAAGNPEILVQAERERQEKQIHSLARKVSGPLPSSRPIPRFHRKMCLVVGGVSEELADAFGTRITENAQLAGVPVETGKCKPNALVVFTDNSRADLAQIRKKNRWMFGNLPRSQFDRMMASRDEVFAWQSTLPMGLTGMAFDIENREFPENRSTVDGGGRLSNTFMIDVAASVVVIDKNALDSKTAMQVADYASMRLLAPTAEVASLSEGEPATIMTLFRDPAGAPPELSPFDIAYLRGVYDIPPNAPSSTVYGQITRNVTGRRPR